MVAACSWCSASHAKAPVRVVEGSGSPGQAVAVSKQQKYTRGIDSKAGSGTILMNPDKHIHKVQQLPHQRLD